jgi:hypothetical protein
MTVPDEAITAAVQAAQAADQAYARLPASQRLREYEDLGWMRVGDRQVRRLLEAAAPLIVAAERDRVRVAFRYTCACQNCKDAIAGLLRDAP